MILNIHGCIAAASYAAINIRRKEQEKVTKNHEAGGNEASWLLTCQ